ncbi:uncharacterized protein K452DRAFT_318425 [Aplosporella prunicola CBS 121167]|uniref:Secreted protein n=1 Tax=Aplosporella prunicola CBS 121167 TaxID=1176127 RepID=A0A6A6BFV5_9PEZI|nr:uncharacterized protein K452DRAFT_318425 [Aplosporella prunicola CBS 121167]KAF2142124.1 hypothetical protein K452DRAFT_318425 [Aplosporella prunicola CBS 121167]
MVQVTYLLTSALTALAAAQNGAASDFTADNDGGAAAEVHQNSKRVINSNNDGGVYWCERKDYKGKCRYTHKPLGTCMWMNRDPRSMCPDRNSWGDKPIYCELWNEEGCKGRVANLEYPGKANLAQWYSPKIRATAAYYWPLPASVRCFKKK